MCYIRSRFVCPGLSCWAAAHDCQKWRTVLGVSAMTDLGRHDRLHSDTLPRGVPASISRGAAVERVSAEQLRGVMWTIQLLLSQALQGPNAGRMVVGLRYVSWTRSLDGRRMKRCGAFGVLGIIKGFGKYLCPVAEQQALGIGCSARYGVSMGAYIQL